ncbi:MAG: hypothetical protein E7641_04290 [Ruminococcaceae bacterium]|nr:hypothetical protein [Oscillospiraceae bacterium]
MNSEKAKKIFKAFLYPHIAIMILLFIVSIVLLILSFLIFDSASVGAIISYVVSAYTLTVWCFRIPEIITVVKKFKESNRFISKWQSDERFRINVSLFSTFALNIIFAVFQLVLGIDHGSFWYYSLAAYYACLACLRISLFKYTGSRLAGEDMRTELIKYRICGWVFLFMNLAITLITFFMIYFGRTFIHHEITTIAIAAYTFIAVPIAIVNAVKYKKYNSPVYSAARAISLAAAAVSILTLESTMLTTFGGEDLTAKSRRLMLALTGAAVSAFIIGMAIYIIYTSTKKLRQLKDNVNNG